MRMMQSVALYLPKSCIRRFALPWFCPCPPVVGRWLAVFPGVVLFLVVYIGLNLLLCRVDVGGVFSLLVCLPRGLGGSCHFLVQVHLLVLGIGLWGVPCLGVLLLGFALEAFAGLLGFAVPPKLGHAFAILAGSAIGF